ncbi:BTAD domain-containing putative transcriptional regulator [Paractinoplanes atraurantiacus]|uniref:DNA-binding transcriptional activator of the SARP family n=1 Tax=Paractinoplanes atraurantiacus TaxID=1036182 RepID=A0A285JYR6_9ACTN|nr:BTAD domain-containing putative transcriptional regulator [Actinoplanes atraurantiacus]SNY65455.1 DNA-binding transcriptional activator of the SARP family [Actinoplanes atraurantiacus]
MWSGCVVRVLGTAGVREAPRLERKAREVLTILTVHAPAAVTLDELARLLWDDPPPSAVKTLRAHISRIRAAIALSAAAVVSPSAAAGMSPSAAVGVPPSGVAGVSPSGVAGVSPSGVAGVERVGRDGYRLAVASEHTDVGLVAAARVRARGLLADGRADSAAAVLAEARELWRGDPELPDTVAAAALRQGWRQERRLLVQEHLGCLAAGADPASALGELERLTAADPLDEPLWAHYVRALNRAGRPTEALRAAATARAALVEVGLDPSPALSAAQTEVLRPPAVQTEMPEKVRVSYATDASGSTAYTRLSERGHDLVVLNPAMLTIDGLLDGAQARAALTALAGHAAVVCLDRRGIGLSDPLDPARPPLEQWADDVRRVLDAAAIPRADLFANFDTGLVALEFAARHPSRVRRLVLAQCFPRYTRSDDYPYGLDRRTTETLIRDTVSPGRGTDSVAQAAPSVVADEAFRQWWNRLGRRAAAPAVATAIRAVATGADVRHRLPEVTAPTLILHRRNCLNVDIGHARYLATHLPSAHLRTTPGTDALWFTDSAELRRYAADFLTA